jgi:hypothetical protein
MSTNQSSQSTSLPPGAEELGTEVQNTFNSADTLAAQQLDQLRLVQQARLSRMSRELAQAKAQKPPDSQAVQTAQAAVDAATVTAGRVAMAQQQSTTSDPQVAPDGWALHGRVVDSGLTAVSGFTVFLVDSENTYQQALGFAYTDDTGYFLIHYAGPQGAAKSQADNTSSSTRASEQTTPKGSGGASQSGSAPQLFLEIANASAQPVFLSQVAFQPVTGGAIYQNIILAPGSQPIGDPPQAIRDVALPRGIKKTSASRGRKL